MRFTPSAEQRDFAASLRESLASWAGHRTEPDAPTQVWSRLADAGATALGTPEKLGGFGADAVDLVVGFEELGRAAAPGPLVESIAVLPALLAGTPDEDRVAALASGELVGTVAMPPHVPFAVDAQFAGAAYIATGTSLHRAATVRTHASVDATRELVEVRPGDLVAHGVDMGPAFDLGALATAAQILGAGHELLDRAVGYAKQRSQFGRPIGSFQAVKHHVADAAVALELARPLLFGAALAVRDRLPTRSRDVSAAKVACTDAAYLASRVSLQVHGAIGYTAEYDLSLWLTKVRALVSAWGTQRVHRDRVAAALRSEQHS
jgi:alkylation response protein AidB-like acyl-CoA dehydrogenase